jgi:hypothetical protein
MQGNLRNPAKTPRGALGPGAETNHHFVVGANVGPCARQLLYHSASPSALLSFCFLFLRQGPHNFA